MTTTKIDIPTEDQKTHLRDLLNNQVREYLANGGRITKIPPGVSAKDSLFDPIWSKSLRNKEE